MFRYSPPCELSTIYGGDSHEEYLHFSEGTVRNYVSSIFAKLEVSDHTQAAVFALRYGLADPDR